MRESSIGHNKDLQLGGGTSQVGRGSELAADGAQNGSHHMP